MKTKKVPFDIEKAKNGAKVITMDGRSVDIKNFNNGDEDYPITAIIKPLAKNEHNEVATFTKKGIYYALVEDNRDLFILELEPEFQLLPFDLERAKAGAKVVTRCGKPARIVDYAIKDKNHPILGLIDHGLYEIPETFTNEGRAVSDDVDSEYDLFIEENVEEDDDYGRVCMINQDEEPDDNKPKFQKGDWVVFKQDGNAHQIIRVVENATSHTYGYDTVDNYYFNDTAEGVRRWTIQEAKNGDVLRSTGLHNDCIFIFSGLDNWKFDADGDRAVATGYCCLDITADKMEFGIQGPDCIEVNTIKPATKEQRDLLFQKMKEAGYEWDKEKKELKKIKTRRMTNQELSWWLRDCPEEHREYRYKDNNRVLPGDYYYLDDTANKEVNDVYIRRNGGEWEEPLVEI